MEWRLILGSVSPNYETFLIFLNFLKFYILSCLASREATRIQILKKYHDQDCLESFILLTLSLLVITVSGNSPILVKKKVILEKPPATTVQGFLMSSFDLN